MKHIRLLGIRFRFVIILVFLLSLFLTFSNLPDKNLPEISNITSDSLPDSNIVWTVEHFDSLINAQLKNVSTVGAAIAVVYKGDVIWTKCYGVKKVGGNDSIDPHTVFRLASVSKPLSGLLAGIMADKKIVSLDEPIVGVLPGFHLKDSSSTYGLTLRHLLSHTSGLVPHAYDNLVEARVPFATIMDSLYRVNVSAQPGRLYGYQNVMFSLFDTLTTLLTQKGFDYHMDEYLFSPLQMNDASLGYPPFSKNSNKAFPHVKYNGKYNSLPLNNRYYNTEPAAGINASISDMAKLLQGLMVADSDIIKPAVVDSVLKPQVVSPLRRSYLRQWGTVESKHYALGWRVIGYKNHTIAYHGGYVQGYRSEIAFSRKDSIGIVYLSNSPNKVASQCVPQFLNLYFSSLNNDTIQVN